MDSSAPLRYNLYDVDLCSVFASIYGQTGGDAAPRVISQVPMFSSKHIQMGHTCFHQTHQSYIMFWPRLPLCAIVCEGSGTEGYELPTIFQRSEAP